MRSCSNKEPAEALVDCALTHKVTDERKDAQKQQEKEKKEKKRAAQQWLCTRSAYTIFHHYGGGRKKHSTIDLPLCFLFLSASPSHPLAHAAAVESGFYFSHFFRCFLNFALVTLKNCKHEQQDFFLKYPGGEEEHNHTGPAWKLPPQNAQQHARWSGERRRVGGCRGHNI